MSITKALSTRTAQLMRRLVAEEPLVRLQPPPHPARGTKLSTYCVDGNKHTVLADGEGGAYEDTILLNDLDCLKSAKRLE